LDDEGGVVLDDETAGEFVATALQLLGHKIKVFVATATVEDFGADDKGKKSWRWQDYSSM
jgi:hypothetical protein